MKVKELITELLSYPMDANVDLVATNVKNEDDSLTMFRIDNVERFTEKNVMINFVDYTKINS